MWNKRETESNNTSQASTTPTAASPPKQSKPLAPSKAASSSAVIGPSISIKGDLSGEEDLLIEGRVEGEVRLNQHSITVGRSGRVSADVYGQSINVEGEVHGNLTGDNEVVIRNTGRVEGNIVAPRVTLEDGSSFRGAIDMQTPQASRQSAKAGHTQHAPGQKKQKGHEGAQRTKGNQPSEVPA